MSRRVLSIDLETYSDVDLVNCGIYRYVEGDFHILLFAYAFDDEDVQCVDLACGEKLPEEVVDAIHDSNIIKSAWNAQFERTCLSKYFGTQLSPDSWQCTMVWAASLSLPLKLKLAAQVLKTGEQKDDAGERLIRYFSIPCKATKSNGGRTRNLPEHAPDDWKLFKSYCIQDVKTERDIRKRLEQFPMMPNEWDYYHMDQRINDRGVLIDKELVQQAIICDMSLSEEMTKRAYALTGLENPNSVSQLKGWLEERGICKSISRLSRNTADTVEIIRKLKTLGITCYFEKEDLDTGDMQSEFILTTLAALAQEESRTISENMRWSMEKRSPRGDVPNMRCYGYELSDEFETTETGYKRRKVVIVPEEAEIVKKIFMLYVDGKNIAEITRILNGEKVPAPNLKYGWMKEKIRYILKNERYCGDVLTQKTYTEDFLTHKNKRNRGEISQYYIKNHHPAIITRDLFQKAQKRRKKDTNARKRREYRYSGRLVCAHCGKNHAAIRERYSIFWKCSSAMLNNGMRICNAERISQIILDLMLINAVDARFPDSELIAKLESTQDLDFMERDRSIMKKQIAIAEMELDDAVKAYEEFQNKIEVLKMRQEIFGEKTDLTSYFCKCDELKNTITTLEKEKSALESELDRKEKHWELLERDHAIRDELIEFLKTASEKELRNRLPCYVKALVLSIIVHDTEHFTVRWFDGTETDTTI